jgi:hypothetical protein
MQSESDRRPVAPQIIVNEPEPSALRFSSLEPSISRVPIQTTNPTSPPTPRANRRPPSPERSDSRRILPDPFLCVFHWTLDGECYQEPTNFLVPWKDDKAYEDAYAMMEKTVVQRLEAGNILGTKQQYLKHGSCQTVSKYRTEPPRPLGNREEWAEIRSILINEYASWGTVDDFRLKVTCDYSAVQIDPLDDKSHYTHMAEELDNKMKENFQPRRYIPRIDLMKIVTNESIRRTIESHKSYLMLRQQIGFESGEAFIGRVQRDARTLLAICVYLELDMNCLKMFLDADITDESLPLNESHCPHDKYKRKFRQLLDNQGSFIAHEFVKEGEHHEVDSRVVVPIIFKEEVGGGGFATVYQGQVDPDHLHFAKVCGS